MNYQCPGNRLPVGTIGSMAAKWRDRIRPSDLPKGQRAEPLVTDHVVNNFDESIQILSSAVPYRLERARQNCILHGKVGFGMKAGVGGSGRDLDFEKGRRVSAAVIIFPSVKAGTIVPSWAVEAPFVSVVSGPKNGG
jgi:hypothetical protein